MLTIISITSLHRKNLIKANRLYWFSHIIHIHNIIRPPAHHSTLAWVARCPKKCERLAYPFPQCSHLYLGSCWCTCLTCSFNPLLLTKVRRHFVHAKLLPSCTAEMWWFNVLFHLNVDVQKGQLYEIRVNCVSLWFILPTETHLVALAANCPPVCAAGQPVTTWERHKHYDQFTTVVLEVRNIELSGESGNPQKSITITDRCRKWYTNI